MRDVLNEWPNDKKSLARFTPSGPDAHRWLDGTQLRVAKTQFMTRPPDAEPSKGKWMGNVGRIYATKKAQIEFELPLLTKHSGIYEIILLDASPSTPSEARFIDILTLGGLMQSAFRYLTGMWAGLRLIAPAYEREEILDVPEQDIIQVAKLLQVLRPIQFPRFGPHCRRVKSGRPREWACPLREAGECAGHHGASQRVS